MKFRFLLPLAAAVAFGQSQPLKQFEVASVKPNVSGSTSSDTNSQNGSFTAVNVTLRSLIRNAFDILDLQLDGLPAWAAVERWDVTAKASTSRPASRAEVREMEVTFLAERFHLKYHRETREVPIYALQVAKSGLKMAKSALGEADSSTHSDKGEIRATAVSIPDLAGNLTYAAGRMVRDETGLTGLYDFKLEWSTDQALDLGPSIFTAIQEQLGLRLESKKGPLEMIVIDSVARASEN